MVRRCVARWPFRRRAPHLRLGARGERIAARVLRRSGYRVVARNYRPGRRPKRCGTGHRGMGGRHPRRRRGQDPSGRLRRSGGAGRPRKAPPDPALRSAVVAAGNVPKKDPPGIAPPHGCGGGLVSRYAFPAPPGSLPGGLSPPHRTDPTRRVLSRVEPGRRGILAGLSPRPGGTNSVVECNLAKVEVAGSNPVSRSSYGSVRAA